MAARLGALVLAVAMVAGAIFVRGRIDRSRSTFRLTCATELEDACRAIGHGADVTIEPAGTTADRLIALPPGDDPGIDAWLAPGPWPQIVDAARPSAPLFAGDKPALGQSRIGVVAGARRAAALQQACTPLTWDCVAAAMGADNGKADIPDPGTEATGPLVLAAIAAGRAVDDPALLTRLLSLQRVRTLAGGDAVANVLTTNGADLGLVGALDADVGRTFAQAAPANRAAATTLYPDPKVVAEVVLGVTGSGKAAQRAREIVAGQIGAKVLRDDGWTAAADGTPLRDAAVVAALRDAWKRQQ